MAVIALKNKETRVDSTLRLDHHYRSILIELQVNGRLSHAELARRIGLSATATADRVRELETAGIIRGYGVVLDPSQLDLPIIAFITMTCDGDRCRQLASKIGKFPAIIECHRLTGDASALLKVAVQSIAKLEALVDQLSVFGKPSTAIVLSSPLTGRPLPLETDLEASDRRARKA